MLPRFRHDKPYWYVGRGLLLLLLQYAAGDVRERRIHREVHLVEHVLVEKRLRCRSERGASEVGSEGGREGRGNKVGRCVHSMTAKRGRRQRKE